MTSSPGGKDAAVNRPSSVVLPAAAGVRFCRRAALLPPAFRLELTMKLGKCSGAAQVVQLADGLQYRPAVRHTRLDAPDEKLVLGPLSSCLV